MRKFKKYRLIIIIIILEGLSFRKYPNATKEMIFLVWAFVYLAFFLQKFSNGKDIFPAGGISGSDSSRYASSASNFSTSLDKNYNQAKYITTNKRVDILLVLLFLVNVFLSIINS